MTQTLTLLEKLHLEGIESLAEKIDKVLQDNDDVIQDFVCDTMEEDSEKFTNIIRGKIVDEVVCRDLVKLVDLIDDFKTHRKQRRL